MKGFLLAIDWSMVKIGFVLLCMGIFTVILETIVMLVFKFDRFGKNLVYAIMANIGSVLLGVLLFLIFNKAEFAISEILELFILYCITSVFEGWLIKLLNAAMGWRKILVTSFVMNLVSFTALYLTFTQFLSKYFTE